jgi:hypothetical protein
MIHRMLRLMGALVMVLVVVMCARVQVAQSTASSEPASPQGVKDEPAKTNGQSPATSSSEIPAIDPDVKQWFLERMKVRRPYDPRDVDILTGRTREAERMNDYQANGAGYWLPFRGGYGDMSWGPWSRGFHSPFASSSFLLFRNHRHSFFLGNSFGLGGAGFFFGRPFFRTFGFQRRSFMR